MVEVHVVGATPDTKMVVLVWEKTPIDEIELDVGLLGREGGGEVLGSVQERQAVGFRRVELPRAEGLRGGAKLLEDQDLGEDVKRNARLMSTCLRSTRLVVPVAVWYAKM